MNRVKTEESVKRRNSNITEFNLNKISIIFNNIKKRKKMNTESSERKTPSIYNKMHKSEININNNDKINNINNSKINTGNKIDNNNNAFNISNLINNNNKININNKINKISKIINIKKSEIKTSFNDLQKKRNIIYIKKLNENNNKKIINNLPGKDLDKNKAKEMFKSILDRKRRYKRILKIKNSINFNSNNESSLYSYSKEYNSLGKYKTLRERDVNKENKKTTYISVFNNSTISTKNKNKL